MPVKGSITNFTAKGGTVSGYRPVGNVEVGVINPNTGKIVKGPVQAVDLGLASSSHVKVLNPGAMSQRAGHRAPTIGAGQQGGDRRY